MARSSRQLLGPARYTVNQNGAPEPETTAETVTVGRQSGERADAGDKPAAKAAPAKS